MTRVIYKQAPMEWPQIQYSESKCPEGGGPALTMKQYILSNGWPFTRINREEKKSRRKISNDTALNMGPRHLETSQTLT